MKFFDRIKAFFTKKTAKVEVEEVKEEVQAVEPVATNEVVAPNSEANTIDNVLNTYISKFMMDRKYTVDGLKKRAVANITNEEIKLVAEEEAVDKVINNYETLIMAQNNLSNKDALYDVAHQKVVEYRKVLKPYQEKKSQIEEQKKYLATLEGFNDVEEFEKCLYANIQYRLLNKLRLKFMKSSKEIDVYKFAGRKYKLAKGTDVELQTKQYTRDEIIGIFLANKKSNFDSADIKANIVSVLNGNGSITFEGDKQKDLIKIYKALKRKYAKAANRAAQALTELESESGKSSIDIYKECAHIESVDCSELAAKETEATRIESISAHKSDLNLYTQLDTVTYEEFEAALINRISAKYLKAMARNIKVYNSDYKNFEAEHKDGCKLAQYAKVPVTKIDNFRDAYLK